MRRAGWTLWVLQLLALSVDVTVKLAHNTEPTLIVLNGLFFLLLGFSFSTVGALVLRRAPRNRMAWFLLLVPGPAIAVPALLDAYALQGLVNAPGSLPGAAAVAGANQGSWVLAIGSIAVFTVLLFPDGRLPSRSWRWLAALGAADITVIAVATALEPGTISEGSGRAFDNPIGLESLRAPLDGVFSGALAVLTLCLVAAAVAMVSRFRRSHGIERLQLTWFAAAAGLVALSFLIYVAAQFAKPTPFEGKNPGWLLVLQELTFLSLLSLPVAIGTAIMRHRLYDIDRLINRTLVYGGLTATLLLTYLGLVLGLQKLLNPVTGESDLAVAASTLTVAALFRPARARIQALVDMRFYRRRYDAAQTVEGFVGRLRQEVDLDSVSDDLGRVVAETMQPEHVSLWLRETS